MYFRPSIITITCCTMNVILSALFFLLQFGSSNIGSPGIEQNGKIVVTISGLRNDKGTVLVSLYNKAEHFPKDAARFAIGKATAPITRGTATVVFPNLPYGSYAAAFLHDENNNIKMDFNFIGIPKEGFGFSNNAKGMLGPPPFKKAVVYLNANEKKVNIKANYYL